MATEHFDMQHYYVYVTLRVCTAGPYCKAKGDTAQPQDLTMVSATLMQEYPFRESSSDFIRFSQEIHKKLQSQSLKTIKQTLATG